MRGVIWSLGSVAVLSALGGCERGVPDVPQDAHSNMLIGSAQRRPVQYNPQLAGASRGSQSQKMTRQKKKSFAEKLDDGE